MIDFFQDSLDWLLEHQVWVTRLTSNSSESIYNMTALDFEAYLMKLANQIRQEKDDSDGNKGETTTGQQCKA